MANSYWGMPVSIVSAVTDPIDTDRSTVETIQQMIALARSSASDPLITSIVNELLLSLPKNPSHKELARAIYYFVKRKVTFVEDEEILAKQLGYTDLAHELLISPTVLLRMPRPMGDCDDFSMLVASLLCAAQIPVRFVAIAVDPNEQFRFSHVYTRAYLADEDRWIALDCSHGSMLGWEKKEKYRIAEFNV